MTRAITVFCFVFLMFCFQQAWSAQSLQSSVDSFATKTLKALESDVTGLSILEISRLPQRNVEQGIRESFAQFFNSEHIKGAKQLCDVTGYTLETTFGNLTDKTFWFASAQTLGKTLVRKKVLNKENASQLSLQVANAIIMEAKERNISTAAGKWMAVMEGVNDFMNSLQFKTKQWIYAAVYYGVGTLKCNAEKTC